VQDEILKTLLYYDIWRHPLTARELFRFLPVNSVSFEEFARQLHPSLRRPEVSETRGYFYLSTHGPEIVIERERRAAHARWLWRRARISMHLIRRFPFVRAVFVSGDLSKNSTTPDSDVDFFILTEPNRLWIARTLLILFKKVFLLNSKKYFCLNYFAATSSLALDEQSLYVATEVATVKPLYNSELFTRYLEANRWIQRYFPNFALEAAELPEVCNRHSVVQRILETLLRPFPLDRIDRALLAMMERVWRRRYPELDEPTRSSIYRSTPTESRAYAGNFQEKILTLYRQRCAAHGIRA